MSSIPLQSIMHHLPRDRSHQTWLRTQVPHSFIHSLFLQHKAESIALSSHKESLSPFLSTFFEKSTETTALHCPPFVLTNSPPLLITSTQTHRPQQHSQLPPPSPSSNISTPPQHQSPHLPPPTPPTKNPHPPSPPILTHPTKKNVHPPLDPLHPPLRPPRAHHPHLPPSRRRPLLLPPPPFPHTLSARPPTHLLTSRAATPRRRPRLASETGTRMGAGNAGADSEHGSCGGRAP